MRVDWNKCNGNTWCKLNNVNLRHEHFDDMMGIYIIWHGGNNPQTVRVGQGFIKDRLESHRSDAEVQAYADLGLYVTWACAQKNYLDGVEVFLAQNLNPLVGERFPDARPITVNLPW